jgi:pre-mRNA-splicing helicase BRR2
MIGKKLAILTGTLTTDLKILDTSDVVISNPENWDQVTRRWKQRKVLKKIDLFVADDLHLINERNCTLEIIVSRMRYI